MPVVGSRHGADDWRPFSRATTNWPMAYKGLSRQTCRPWTSPALLEHRAGQNRHRYPAIHCIGFSLRKSSRGLHGQLFVGGTDAGLDHVRPEGIGVSQCLYIALSQGELRIRSCAPRQPPYLYFNLMDHPFDPLPGRGPASITKPNRALFCSNESDGHDFPFSQPIGGPLKTENSFRERGFDAGQAGDYFNGLNRSQRASARLPPDTLR